MLRGFKGEKSLAGAIGNAIGSLTDPTSQNLSF